MMRDKEGKILGIVCIILAAIGVITSGLGAFDIIKPVWLSFLPLLVLAGIGFVLFIIGVIEIINCLIIMKQLDREIREINKEIEENNKKIKELENLLNENEDTNYE